MSPSKRTLAKSRSSKGKSKSTRRALSDKKAVPAVPELPQKELQEMFNDMKEHGKEKVKKTYLVATAKIVLSPSMGMPTYLIDSMWKALLNSTNAPSFTTGLMTLSDGSIFSVGFLSVVRESYAKRLNRWDKGDEIQFTYTGGARAKLFSGNYWLIKNKTRNEYILGDKLQPMYG